jgi:cytoskeleton protein RodZ
MAEIGSTLRETRIRKKIDITTVEEATKIRAKYLRAIENEEWNVLPGPTYVKTFLRTYAQYLGLDAHLLVDEYSARFEQPEDLELPAFSREPRIRTRVRRAGPPSRLTAVGVIAAAIVLFLLVLGLTAGNDNGKSSSSDRSRNARKGASHHKKPSTAAAPAPAKPGGQVKVAVVATRPVWVCLVDSRNNPRVNGQILPAGSRQGPFTSKEIKVTVGNGGGDLQINGKLRNTPERSRPLSYAITSAGTQILPPARRPTCG